MSPKIPRFVSPLTGLRAVMLVLSIDKYQRHESNVHSSLRKLSTIIRFPDLGVEDRMIADENSAIAENPSSQLTLTSSDVFGLVLNFCGGE